MSPSARTRGEVPTTGVPLSVGQSVVVRSTQVLDADAPLLLRLARSFAPDLILVKVEVPELQLGLRRRADSREHDVPPAR